MKKIMLLVSAFFQVNQLFTDQTLTNPFPVDNLEQVYANRQNISNEHFSGTLLRAIRFDKMNAWLNQKCQKYPQVGIEKESYRPGSFGEGFSHNSLTGLITIPYHVINPDCSTNRWLTKEAFALDPEFGLLHEIGHSYNDKNNFIVKYQDSLSAAIYLLPMIAVWSMHKHDVWPECVKKQYQKLEKYYDQLSEINQQRIAIAAKLAKVLAIAGYAVFVPFYLGAQFRQYDESQADNYACAFADKAALVKTCQGFKLSQPDMSSNVFQKWMNGDYHYPSDQERAAKIAKALKSRFGVEV